MSRQHGAANGQLHGVIRTIRPFLLVGLPLVDELDDLGKAHGADDEGGEGDAAHQVDAAEVIPGHTGKGVHADGGHQNAQHGDDHALGGILADEPADGGHSDQQHQGHLRIAEVEAQLGKAGGGDGQDQNTDGAADEGGGVGRHQSLAGTALLGHGIAVQSGGDGRGVAGDVQQNGAEGTAIHVGVIQGAQHDDGGGGLELIGQGQQQGNACQGAQAGHGTHDEAQDGAQHTSADVLGVKDHLEAHQQGSKIF